MHHKRELGARPQQLSRLLHLVGPEEHNKLRARLGQPVDLLLLQVEHRHKLELLLGRVGNANQHRPFRMPLSDGRACHRTGRD